MDAKSISSRFLIAFRKGRIFYETKLGLYLTAVLGVAVYQLLARFKNRNYGFLNVKDMKFLVECRQNLGGDH